MSIGKSAKVVTFMYTRDPAKAKAFYGKTLGFAQTSEDDDFFYLSYAIGSGSAPKQIVVQAFFPATYSAAPAYRLPFQSVALDQHVAGWASTMVR